MCPPSIRRIQLSAVTMETNYVSGRVWGVGVTVDLCFHGNGTLMHYGCSLRFHPSGWGTSGWGRARSDHTGVVSQLLIQSQLIMWTDVSPLITCDFKSHIWTYKIIDLVLYITESMYDLKCIMNVSLSLN